MHGRRGFTLSEIMIVCAILAIMTGGMTVVYGTFGARSREVLAGRERAVLRRAIDTYVRVTGRLPRQPEDLLDRGVVVLAPVRRPEGTARELWLERWTFVRRPDGAIVDVEPRAGVSEPQAPAAVDGRVPGEESRWR